MYFVVKACSVMSVMLSTTRLRRRSTTTFCGSVDLVRRSLRTFRSIESFASHSILSLDDRQLHAFFHNLLNWQFPSQLGCSCACTSMLRCTCNDVNAVPARPLFTSSTRMLSSNSMTTCGAHFAPDFLISSVDTDICVILGFCLSE